MSLVLLKGWFKSRTRRAENSLTKFVSLSPKSLHLRLALEHVENEVKKIDLDCYYEASQPVFERRNKTFYWYCILFFGIFLLKLQVVVSVELPNVNLSPEAVGFILLLLFSIVAVLFSEVQSKVYRYQSLFEAVYNSSSAAKKQDLLLRFPRMFSGLQYENWLSARPRYMHPMKTFPKRLTLLLLLTLPVLLAFALGGFALLVSFSVDLWKFESNIVGIWGKLIVMSSWVFLVFALLMPTISYSKIKFEHYGMVDLLTRLQKRDPVRHAHFMRKIAKTSHGSFLIKNPEKG